MNRLAPSQNTDYIALMSEFAVGLYSELDFKNESTNQAEMSRLFAEHNVAGVYVPKVFPALCSRRLLVSEWINGRKLSSCSPPEIAALIPMTQEVFLQQLLSWGFFHADPHPGNLMAMDDTSGGYSIALLDFGLVARLSQADMDALISAVVHLSNADYAALIDDFQALKILPADTPRTTVEGLMARVIGPYVAGGGGLTGAVKAYGGRSGIQARRPGHRFFLLFSSFSHFFCRILLCSQSLTSDLVGALSSVSFSIPSYFALLARAVAVLEGIALTGNPEYRIVLEGAHSHDMQSGRLLLAL